MTLAPTPAPDEPNAPAVAPPRWRDVARQRGMLLTIAVVLLMAAGVAFGLMAVRQQIVEDELRMIAALSAATAERADGTLAIAETAMRATADGLAAGAIVPDSLEAQRTLRTRASALPMFRKLVVIDAQGHEVATSTGDPDKQRNYADTAYFKAAREASGPPFRVGRPSRSAGLEGDTVALSLPWTGPGGRFLGVVVLFADSEFLDGGFARSAPTPDTALAIYRRDGDVVSDGPGDGRAKLLATTTVLTLLGEVDRHEARVIDDGTKTLLLAPWRLERAPLMIVVSRDQDSVLEEWEEQAGLVGAFATSALLVTLGLSLRNARERQWRQAGEAVLQAERERAVRASMAAREGIWEWSPAEHRLYLSPRMKELLGLPRDAVTPGIDGLLGVAGLHGDDVGPLRAALQDHLEGRAGDFRFTLRVDGGAGAWRHVRLGGQALRDASGAVRIVGGTAYDISAEVAADLQSRRLDEQLQRARRLEALGTLAGGVAHDFNNILAAVLGYGERARAAVSETSDTARHLDHVLRAGQRGKALVERVLSFSRTGQRVRVPFRVQPVLEEVLELIESSIPPTVTLTPRLQAPEAVVIGDSTAVFETIMNVCTNGLQAMDRGGELTVELSIHAQRGTRHLSEGTLAPGPHVRLSVIDTGSGITPEALPHLFEPFFTTKGPNRGTGLGLAVVHGTLRDMGGAVDVQTARGRGTRFDLYWPLASAAADHDGTVDGHIPRGQGQVVMVVDDEAALVELAEEQLADLGYDPRGYADAAKALAELALHPDAYDLIVTDQVMPALTGTELARRAGAVRPGLPVLIVSGFGGADFEALAAGAGALQVLNKPLDRAELARAIDRALRRPLPGGA